MIRHSINFIAVIILMALAVSVPAQEANCSFDAWVSHKDTNGLNVRSGPGPKSKIVGKLKHDDGDDDKIVTVVVAGYQNGWVKISMASTVGGDTLFEGEGWITAKAVKFRTERTDGNSAKRVILYSRASKSSGVAARIPDEAAVRIIGFSCFGPKVSYAGKSGWLSRDDLCGNPVTTCP
jgi:uncharacterized protein YgiM (DUF1202 family)